MVVLKIFGVLDLFVRDWLGSDQIQIEKHNAVCLLCERGPTSASNSHAVVPPVV